MHNLYGNRKLNALEIKGAFTLSNGMYCVWGNPDDEGLSIDVYDDSSRKLLVGMEHNIKSNCTENKQTAKMLTNFAEGLKKEFEDSMVYYYGPFEHTLTKSDIKRPVPKKTGRFTKNK